MIRFLIALIVLFSSQSVFGETTLARKHLDTLIMKESSGDIRAIGDKYDSKGNLKPESEWSYGPYQISRGYITDYNTWNNTNHVAKDCWGNLELSEKVVIWYLNHYVTPERLGRPVTDRDYFRVHNGGPAGCFDNGCLDKNGRKPKTEKRIAEVARSQRNAKAYAEDAMKILEG